MTPLPPSRRFSAAFWRASGWRLGAGHLGTPQAGASACSVSACPQPAFQRAPGQPRSAPPASISARPRPAPSCAATRCALGQRLDVKNLDVSVSACPTAGSFSRTVSWSPTPHPPQLRSTTTVLREQRLTSTRPPRHLLLPQPPSHAQRLALPWLVSQVRVSLVPDQRLACSVTYDPCQLLTRGVFRMVSCTRRPPPTTASCALGRSLGCGHELSSGVLH